MFIIRYKYFFIGLSILLMIASLTLLGIFGLRPGIDFTGGAVLEVNYPNGAPSEAEIKVSLEKAGFPEATLRLEESNVAVTVRPIEEAQRAELILAMNLDKERPAVEKQFLAIGPSIGKELTQKAIVSVLTVTIAIILFVAFAFRQVSRPISSWWYGFITIATLLHDVLVPSVLMAILGHSLGVTVDSLFIVALLTVLGLSVNDTIVVFDRIRENLRRRVDPDFATTVGISLEQTFIRSINTSLTIVFVLAALFFFGPETTKYFSLSLGVGLIAGTYSSIFLASPLLVLVADYKAKKRG